MSLKGQLILLLYTGFFSFCNYRVFINGLKEYLLNKSEQRERAKKETLIKRFLYSNYKDVLPVGSWVAYYVFSIVHIFLILLCVVLYLVSPQTSFSVGNYIAKCTCVFDGVVITVLHLLLRYPDHRDHYDRWVKKR